MLNLRGTAKVGISPPQPLSDSSGKATGKQQTKTLKNQQRNMHLLSVSLTHSGLFYPCLQKVKRNLILLHHQRQKKARLPLMNKRRSIKKASTNRTNTSTKTTIKKKSTLFNNGTWYWETPVLEIIALPRLPNYYDASNENGNAGTRARNGKFGYPWQ